MLLTFYEGDLLRYAYCPSLHWICYVSGGNVTIRNASRSTPRVSSRFTRRPGVHVELLRGIGPQKASTVPIELRGKFIKRRWYSSRQRGCFVTRHGVKNGWVSVLEAENLYMHCVATGNDHLVREHDS
jgi:hypothetical protein